MGAVIGHTCAHTWPIITLVQGPFLPPYIARCCLYTWPIPAPIYGSLLLLYMAHSCPYKLYIASAKRLVHFRNKAWRFLTAFRIVLIFVPLNGAYMRAYIGHTGAAMGHVCAHIWAIYGVYIGHMGAAMGQQWGMHARIHGHIWGVHTRIHGHIWGQQWGMRARIHGHVWGSPIGRAGTGNNRESLPFPVFSWYSLLFPVYSLPCSGEGNRGQFCPFPSLFRGVSIIL